MGGIGACLCYRAARTHGLACAEKKVERRREKRGRGAGVWHRIYAEKKASAKGRGEESRRGEAPTMATQARGRRR